MALGKSKFTYRRMYYKVLLYDVTRN